VEGERTPTGGKSTEGDGKMPWAAIFTAVGLVIAAACLALLYYAYHILLRCCPRDAAADGPGDGFEPQADSYGSPLEEGSAAGSAAGVEEGEEMEVEVAGPPRPASAVTFH